MMTKSIWSFICKTATHHESNNTNSYNEIFQNYINGNIPIKLLIMPIIYPQLCSVHILEFSDIQSEIQFLTEVVYDPDMKIILGPSNYPSMHNELTKLTHCITEFKDITFSKSGIYKFCLKYKKQVISIANFDMKFTA